jgi:hypothetical protein
MYEDMRIPMITQIPDLLAFPGNGGGGGSPTLWMPEAGVFDHIYRSDVPANVTLSGSAVTSVANTGTAGGAASEASASLQPSINIADLNGFDTFSLNGDRLVFPQTFAVGWSVFMVFLGDSTNSAMTLLGEGAGGTNTLAPLAQPGSGLTNVWTWNNVNDVPVPSIRVNGTSTTWATRGAAHSALNANKWRSTVLTNCGPCGSSINIGQSISGFSLVGKFAWFVAKAAIFTSDEINRLEGAAAHHFGGDLLTDLNAASPYKSSAPTV